MFRRLWRVGISLPIVACFFVKILFCDPLPPLVYYDMTALFGLDLKNPQQLRQFYDETFLVVSLQGLVNREQPRLYIQYNTEPDTFWWKRMTEDGGWLQNRETIHLDRLEDLLAHFHDSFAGSVVWDERVPATSNVAATIAGCENLLVIRYDTTENSIYRRVVQNGPKIAIKRSLLAEDGSSYFKGQGSIPETDLPSSGSAKCDAYLWLIERYVKPGKINPKLLGYYLDGFWLQCGFASSPQNHTLTNLDFIIANRGLCFDLNVWTDETPVDDPNQKPGTDEQTLKAILRSMYDQFHGEGVIHAAGFTPWAFKYTDYQSSIWNAGGKHGGVPTEWKYAEILSCFNAFMDADALGTSSMANASFFQHIPLPEFIPQNPKPTTASLREQGILDTDGHIVPRYYVAHYVGDYDSAAWLYWMLPRMWEDPNRGQIPLSWAFNPNLAIRFPLGMLWSRQHRTDNDFFVAGDSGAGYLNPGLLSEPRPHSNLPSGMNAWETHCTKWYQQWDLSLTGFIIDGNGQGLSEEGLDAYARFSSGGIVPQKIPPQGVHQGMPFLRMGVDLPGSPVDAARVIQARMHGAAPQFTVNRSILMTPSWYAEVSKELKTIAGDSIRVVDMYTLLWLVKEYQTHPEFYPRSSTPFASAKQIRGTPKELQGIQAIYVSDGPIAIQDKENIPCWLLTRHPSSQYLYFDVADDFYESGSGTLRMDITYFDEGQGEFRIQYDAIDPSETIESVYKQHPHSMIRNNANQWQTASLRIDDARFQNNQNNSTDFRIYNPGDDLWIREISIQRIEEKP